VALVASRFGRRPAIGGALYLAAMGFSLVYLGEHYASDVFAGIALGSFAWFAALKLTPRPVQRPAAITSPVPAEPLHRAA
jgi:membrane-associated phospholipid phosphatase